MNASAAWEFRHSVAFVAHPPGRVAESGFDEFMEDMRAHPDTKGVVIIANDSPPGAHQRAVVQQWFERNRSARAAVLTSSILARGAVTALNWFGVPVQAFAPEQLALALDFVKLPKAHHADAEELLGRLRERVRPAEHQRPARERPKM